MPLDRAVGLDEDDDPDKDHETDSASTDAARLFRLRLPVIKYPPPLSRWLVSPALVGGTP
ncbi:MAG TPA: hypothetical protein VND96_16410 [Candidatus Micrarchaeaceae archaeon]|nr:hypothetical protein [Candidatus Micrarchaeaceae archaeon]